MSKEQDGAGAYGTVHVMEEEMRAAGVGVFEASSHEAPKERAAPKRAAPKPAAKKPAQKKD